MTELKRGFTFVHSSFIDPDWKPGPGEFYGSGPGAPMVVSQVTPTRVYFKYASAPTSNGFVLPRKTFIERYLKEEPS